MSRNFCASQSGRMSDGQVIKAQRKDQKTKINFKGQRRKQSMRQPYHTMNQIEQLSEKKILSAYNGSASLETLEHESQFGEKVVVEHLKQRVSQLEQQIATIHNSYAVRIEEIAAQHNQKCEIYLNIIDQIHDRHRLEKENYCKMIADFEQERSQISSIEEKMNFINGGIEDILKESAQISNKNKELLQLIDEKDQLLKQKQQAIKDRDDTIKQNEEILDSIDTELKSCRQKVKQYQTALKEYDKMKDQCMHFKTELIEMIDAVYTCPQTAKETNESICTLTKNDRKKCNHCKINKMEKKIKESLTETE